jgi:hypothetical protein
MPEQTTSRATIRSVDRYASGSPCTNASTVNLMMRTGALAKTITVLRSIEALLLGRDGIHSTDLAWSAKIRPILGRAAVEL